MPLSTGVQKPRVSSIPPGRESTGAEAVDLARMAGMVLDPWQELVLRRSLGERDGGWAAFEVAVVAPRQSGKNEILAARQLAGLFLLGERLIISSAHQFDTSLEAFRRLLALIEDTPEFDQRVKRVSRSHGEEGIELKGGQRIRFRTRTKGGGRGFSADCLMLDEAMVLPESVMAALLPILSAREHPQVWYAGSAVDQWIHEHGVVLARIRERGLAGGDPSLAYFEWSADASGPAEVDEAMAGDPEVWAQANPGLGIRISAEHVAKERRSVDRRTFAVERLGVGDWPETDPAGGWAVIREERWAAARDPRSRVEDPVCFAVDVTPDRSHAAIGVAGSREDGLAHVEVVEHRRGTGWVVERVAELVAEHGCGPVVLDGSGPAGSLLTELAGAEVEATALSAREHAQACGVFFDAVAGGTVRHRGESALTDAVRGATKRPLGEAWAWSRKGSSVDISPLVAVTLALWGSGGPPADAGVDFDAYMAAWAG